jgi:GntR family transcriptional regulator/MocR family aminotransferase
MPSSRALAGQLGISRGVVLEAYAQLVAEGYLTASQGAPTRVASAPRAERPPVAAGSLGQSFGIDLDPGAPDLAGFPRAAWLRSLRNGVQAARFSTLGRSDPRGLPELRDELMAYLGRARAAAPEPEHTIVTSGFTQAFSLLCRVLRDRGVERIAMEEPGWTQHRLIAERAGLEPVAVGVDPELGLSVPELERSECEVVVVTPAHQFPTGGVLAPERRTELLEWAEEFDGLIVEDDYDSELRLDRGAVGALQGLAPERVCHIGSTSKRLAPGVGLGWMLSPSWLTGALTFEKGTADGGSPVLEQLALADFIARGELDRHLRRARLELRRRRSAMIGALAQGLPGADVTGQPIGLFALVRLPDAVEEAAVVRQAAQRGISVTGLAEHRLAAGEPPALVLGYGNASEPELVRGVGELCAVVHNLTGI